MYKIVMYKRHDTPIVQPPLTHREALDEQHRLSGQAGQQRPPYMYRVEEIDCNEEQDEVS